MPAIIQGTPATGAPVTVPDGNLLSANFEYQYPEGLDLKPGSRMHTFLVSQILLRGQDSRSYMSNRHGEWRQIDKLLRPYIFQPGRSPRKSANDSSKRPQKTDKSERDKEGYGETIVMPYSFAIRETLLTYLMSAFLRDPIWTYEGQSPDDVLGAMLLTKVIQLHAHKNGVGLNLHTSWADSLSYGIGVVAPYWKVDTAFRRVEQPTGIIDTLRRQFTRTGSRKTVTERQTIFEGNALKNVDPYLYLPDPNVPGNEVQNSEYVGWLELTNYMSLLERENGDPDIFNTRYVQFIDGLSSIASSSVQRDNNTRRVKRSTNKPVDIVWMYVNLIPKEWGLSNLDEPQKWQFGLAGDQVIIAARPLELDHGMFPLVVASPDYDGYTASPMSRMGVVSDLQRLINFLYTSHMVNVKAAVNNRLIVDPYLVNYADVVDPKAGGVIRKRRAAWGKDVKAVEQLQVTDVTRNNIQDVQFLEQMMKEVTSATDPLQGVLQNRTTRVSAAEAQGARFAGMGKLEKVARIISMQQMLPLGEIFAYHTQQFMDQAVWLQANEEWLARVNEVFKGTGQQIRADRGRVGVDPFDILISYDITAHDGTIPGSQNVDSWIQMLQIIAQNPQVSQQFDLFRLVRHIGIQLGANNIDDFIARNPNPPTVMEDQAIQQEIQAGNAVPLEVAA